MNKVSVVDRESLHKPPVPGGLPALVTTLSGIGIPADRMKKYEIALRNQQWLFFVHGAEKEVEQAADFLATGKEIKVAVHQSAWPNAELTSMEPGERSKMYSPVFRFYLQ